MSDEDPQGALIYAAATRALDQQVALLENILTRAGTLLSAASIATSFFAALAIQERDRLTILTGFAVSAFIFSIAVCVRLLIPRGHWTFRFDASALVRNCLDADPPVSIAKMHHDLSKQMDGWANDNETSLNGMLRWFRWAAVGLGVEVAFWIADLVWRR